MSSVAVTGVDTVPNGTYDTPNRHLALEVIRNALGEAGRSVGEVDGLYLPAARPWAEQHLLPTFLGHRLGLDLERVVSAYTGGSSTGVAFHSAVEDVASGAVDTAVVAAVERSSTRSTDEYFEHALSLFDREFHTPVGPTIPGMYALSLQRYLHEYDVDREAVASVVVKNHANATTNPRAYVSEPTSVDAVLNSPPVAEPLHRWECPLPCDGAAALVLSRTPSAARSADPVAIAGVGARQADSHFTGARRNSIASFPAVAPAVEEASEAAGINTAALDVLEPYAPFPHVEAILTEELGFFDRGEGAAACHRGATAADGTIPVSPSGGCLGRGHPPMVTPLLNYAAAIAQCRGEAANQVDGVEHVLTTSEHGHVDGVTATVFRAPEVAT